MNNGYLSTKEIDELTEALIRDYMLKKQKGKIECVDIEGFLIDYLKFNLVYENIAEDDNNKIAFKANGVEPLKVLRDNSVLSIVFSENTVVLDKYLCRYDMSGTKRFTIGHECGHIVKERLYNRECCASYYREAAFSQSVPTSEIREYFKMEETQANNFAAGLLMPRFLVEEKIQRFNGGKKIPIYGRHTLKNSEKIIVQRMQSRNGNQSCILS